MRAFQSLRIRFALWVTILILFFLALFSFGVHYLLSRNLFDAIDESLTLSAEQIVSSLTEEDGRVILPPPDAGHPDPVEFDPLVQRGITLLIISSEKETIQAIGPYQRLEPADSFLSAEPEFRTIPEVNEFDRIRVYSFPIVENDRVIGWVQAMQSLGSAEESLDRLRTLLIIGSGLFSMLAGFAGYFLAMRALAPIDKITQTAHRISTEDLSSRLDLPDTGDEVSRLANTFNEMLDRIESGFLRERQFTSNASHELRTPLTAMQTIIEFTQDGERSQEDYHLALDDLAKETSRLGGLVEDLLQLARGECVQILQIEEIDLAVLLEDVSDSLRPLAERKGFDLELSVISPLVVTGDPDLLIRLVVNLLDNAIKFTNEGCVTISAEEVGDQAWIKFADTGIGIPAEDLSHVFDRFYRVETSRSLSGVGLGLSIAQQIVHTHGGELKIESEPGQGTLVTVLLPTLIR